MRPDRMPVERAHAAEVGQHESGEEQRDDLDAEEQPARLLADDPVAETRDEPAEEHRLPLAPVRDREEVDGADDVEEGSDPDDELLEFHGSAGFTTPSGSGNRRRDPGSRASRRSRHVATNVPDSDEARHDGAGPLRRNGSGRRRLPRDLPLLVRGRPDRADAGRRLLVRRLRARPRAPAHGRRGPPELSRRRAATTSRSASSPGSTGCGGCVSSCGTGSRAKRGDACSRRDSSGSRASRTRARSCAVPEDVRRAAAQICRPGRGREGIRPNASSQPDYRGAPE